MKSELYLKIQSDELGSEEICQDIQYVMRSICLWVYSHYQENRNILVPDVHIIDLNYPVVKEVPKVFRVKAYWMHKYFCLLADAILEQKKLLDTVKHNKYYGELVRKARLKVPHNINAHDFNEETMMLSCIETYNEEGRLYYGLKLKA